MKDCVFCKIVAGTTSANKIYDDDDFIALLDMHPRSPGHAQVIPKKHYHWVWDQYRIWSLVVRINGHSFAIFGILLIIEPFIGAVVL